MSHGTPCGSLTPRPGLSTLSPETLHALQVFDASAETVAMAMEQGLAIKRAHEERKRQQVAEPMLSVFFSQSV
jgi:hypothetical protein